MKPTVALAIALSLAAAACTPAEEPATPPAAEQAPAAQIPPAEETTKTVTAFQASERAYAGAEKACRGCPNPPACEAALTTSLRLTTAALQATTAGDVESNLEERAAQAEAITKQFNGLEELSNECLKGDT